MSKEKTIMVNKETVEMLETIAEKENTTPKEAIKKIIYSNIECEIYKIKIPKKLIPYLEFSRALSNNNSVEEEASELLIGRILADLEGLSPEDVISALGAGKIFYEVLGVERYKPKDA